MDGGSFGAGIAVGIAVGIGTGNGSGAGGAWKKIARQLRNAIDDGQITVRSTTGDTLTADDLMHLLDAKYKKA